MNKKPLKISPQGLSISYRLVQLTPVESKEGLQFNLPNGNYSKAFTLLSTISPVVQRILED